LKKLWAPGARTPTYYNARPRAGGEPWASAVLLRLPANEAPSTVSSERLV